MPEIFADNTSTRALVEYHILKDTHPSASFSNRSQLVSTLLNNTAFTNVTGGQRVELVRKDGQPTFLSAVKAESRISHGDVLYVGGVIHIIDAVLQIPVSVPSTITKAKLTDLVALLDKGNWLTPNSVAYNLTLYTPDLTILGPNNPQYGADFTGWNGLSQEQLDEIFLYHAVPRVIYTTDMKNNSQLPTRANKSITARDYDSATSSESAIFLDQGLLTGANYITSNGVLHILDRILDPSHAGATPISSDVDAAVGLEITQPKQGLTTAAVVGIVIGILAILVTAGLVLALRIRLNRKRQLGTAGNKVSGAISSSRYRQMPPDYQTAVQLPNTTPSRTSQHISIIAARANAPLPPRPRSVARSVASLRGAIWPSRPPQHSIIELDAKDAAYHVTVSEIDSSLSNGGELRPGTAGGGGGETRPIRTPPELDSVERMRRHSSGHSHVSITIQNHGDRPIKHIGFQAQY